MTNGAAAKPEQAGDLATQGRPASETLGPLRVVASGPDVKSVFEQVRDKIAAQREQGLLTGAEAAGAHWATDTIEALTKLEARRRLNVCGLLDADEIADLMLDGVRGG